ncbi:3-hydroxyacyl-CoA dehydrogenase family protein [Microcella alkalica]|uniref:3-hydroxybutyryl-CoA dehydrogenase n=1 Tax=Microcella alkalica TaxID=355930 RepID=A0A839EDE5_9MICO|nr:3-hydroxyacyl-CoA dehydrogenase family protein [Microcella alkalica]MBA8847355.1 3-hydroxybutyryl-CoA dehydrogenase [Microcella alkalica]
MSNTLAHVAVIGAGYMGGGIAQVFAMAGHSVAIADRDYETAQKAERRLVAQARLFEDAHLIPAGAAENIAANISAAPSIEDAATGADYISEAVPEIEELKLSTLRRIFSVAQPEAIVGTNTSALPIEALAVAVTDPGRFLGVHWMNPAPFIPGVEIIPSSMTTAETLATAEAIIRDLGKFTARVSDTPGFVANRLQFALYREAVRILEEGTATADQIDAVVQNSFGFRLALFGPFAIGDMAGLDVYHSSYQTLERAYGDRFSPPRSLVDLVQSGNLGVKSGHGYLDIPDSERAALLEFRDRAYARLSQLRTELGAAPGIGAPK